MEETKKRQDEEEGQTEVRHIAWLRMWFVFHDPQACELQTNL